MTRFTYRSVLDLDSEPLQLAFKRHQFILLGLSSRRFYRAMIADAIASRNMHIASVTSRAILSQFRPSTELAGDRERVTVWG